jgi:DNA-binding NarL/FixJ family response regulator
MAIRVFIYDDNESRRDSLKALIELSPELEYAAAAADCSQAAEDMKAWLPMLY